MVGGWCEPVEVQREYWNRVGMQDNVKKMYNSLGMFLATGEKKYEDAYMQNMETLKELVADRKEQGINNPGELVKLLGGNLE